MAGAEQKGEKQYVLLVLKDALPLMHLIVVWSIAYYYLTFTLQTVNKGYVRHCYVLVPLSKSKHIYCHEHTFLLAS